ncbi:uncharacterized protein V1510DRAFT_439970 [Dipodascopsis tothii]|uniref:uncharacterized protein n=1 Tax=Dipodascopsis tothii TaxID=44089 RepID=UPI0034CDDD6A
MSEQTQIVSRAVARWLSVAPRLYQIGRRKSGRGPAATAGRSFEIRRPYSRARHTRAFPRGRVHDRVALPARLPPDPCAGAGQASAALAASAAYSSHSSDRREVTAGAFQIRASNFNYRRLAWPGPSARQSCRCLQAGPWPRRLADGRQTTGRHGAATTCLEHATGYSPSGVSGRTSDGRRRRGPVSAADGAHATFAKVYEFAQFQAILPPTAIAPPTGSAEHRPSALGHRPRPSPHPPSAIRRWMAGGSSARPRTRGLSFPRRNERSLKSHIMQQAERRRSASHVQPPRHPADAPASCRQLDIRQGPRCHRVLATAGRLGSSEPAADAGASRKAENGAGSCAARAGTAVRACPG